MDIWESFQSVVFVLFGVSTVLWLVSLRTKDVSIVDQFWGISFVLQVWIYGFTNPINTPKQLLLIGLMSIWGLRLAIHLYFRNRGHDEDPRYRAMRDFHGEKKFRWYSLFSVFYLQTCLSLLIGSPFLVIAYNSSSTSLSLIDLFASLIWLVGFVFESLGDWQLRRFKQDPSNQGKILNTGLWSTTRHPNYFGDAVVWWSVFVFSWDLPYGYLSVFGPFVMNVLLLKVSGVSLLEHNLKKKHQNYQEYMASTPAFVPSFRLLWHYIRQK